MKTAPGHLADGMLLENIVDRREGARKKAVVFSPVGDMAQMDEFCRHVKSLGIGDAVDFVFVYRQGLAYSSLLPAVHASEKCPLGTAGCFFAGEKLAYSLGYETIIVADLDAHLDSRRTFDEMLSLCRKSGKVVSPVSTSQENAEKYVAYNFNQWSFFPRAAYETVGMSTPYFWRGGDDYEMICRYRHRKANIVYTRGNVFHPMVGYTVFHKMVQRKKQYTYIAGLLKSLLFIGTYSGEGSAKYLLWHVYYSFAADVFSDPDLLGAVKGAHTLAVEEPEGNDMKIFEVKKVRAVGRYSNISPMRAFLFPAALAHLLLFGHYDIYTDRIYLKMPKWKVLAGLCAAALLLPIRAAQALACLSQFGKYFRKVVFPVTSANMEQAERIYAKLLARHSLGEEGG